MLLSGGSGVILDLRSNTAPDDYRGRGQVVAGSLHPVGHAPFRRARCPAKLPFLFQSASWDADFGRADGRPDRRPDFGRGGSPGRLSEGDGALVVGRATAGNGAVFEEQKLASGQVLAISPGEVTLADGTILASPGRAPT
jgi:hypothetical protein